MDIQVLMKLYGKKHISTKDMFNICLMYDDYAYISSDECEKKENEYFESHNCKTATDRFVLICNTIREGLVKYASDKDNKDLSSKYDYAMINIELIDKYLDIATSKNIDFEQFIPGISKYILSLGFEFNIITGCYTFNKYYYDDMINKAQMSKLLENDIKKGYDLGDNPEKYCYLDDEKAYLRNRKNGNK